MSHAHRRTDGIVRPKCPCKECKDVARRGTRRAGRMFTRELTKAAR